MRSQPRFASHTVGNGRIDAWTDDIAFWQFMYAISGQKLANWLGQGNRLLWLNRLCGAVFIAIAVALAWEVFV